MSILYDDADVCILKLIDWPTLVLNGSANPRMVLPPVALTSHTDCGVPGSWFSHTMGLAQPVDADADGDAEADGVGDGDADGEEESDGDGDGDTVSSGVAPRADVADTACRCAVFVAADATTGATTSEAAISPTTLTVTVRVVPALLTHAPMRPST